MHFIADVMRCPVSQHIKRHMPGVLSNEIVRLLGEIRNHESGFVRALGRADEVVCSGGQFVWFAGTTGCLQSRSVGMSLILRLSAATCEFSPQSAAICLHLYVRFPNGRFHKQ